MLVTRRSCPAEPSKACRERGGGSCQLVIVAKKQKGKKNKCKREKTNGKLELARTPTKLG